MNAIPNTHPHPRIYVACLAAYNNGHLHGVWIDAVQEPERIQEEVDAMLAASPINGAEEWAIHDAEGFGNVVINESDSFARISVFADFINEHGEIGTALLDHYSGDLEEAYETMDGRYLGAYGSLEDYMQELTEETTNIPRALRHYINYRAMGRDAEINGDLFTVSTAWNVVHVFAGY